MLPPLPLVPDIKIETKFGFYVRMVDNIKQICKVYENGVIERFLYYRVFLDSCKNVADKMRLTEFVLQIATKGNIEQYCGKETQQIIKPSLLSFKNECL